MPGPNQLGVGGFKGGPCCSRQTLSDTVRLCRESVKESRFRAGISMRASLDRRCGAVDLRCRAAASVVDMEPPCVVTRLPGLSDAATLIACTVLASCTIRHAVDQSFALNARSINLSMGMSSPAPGADACRNLVTHPCWSDSLDACKMNVLSPDDSPFSPLPPFPPTGCRANMNGLAGGLTLASDKTATSIDVIITMPSGTTSSSHTFAFPGEKYATIGPYDTKKRRFQLRRKAPFFVKYPSKGAKDILEGEGGEEEGGSGFESADETTILLYRACMLFSFLHNPSSSSNPPSSPLCCAIRANGATSA